MNLSKELFGNDGANLTLKSHRFAIVLTFLYVIAIKILIYSHL